MHKDDKNDSDYFNDENDVANSTIFISLILCAICFLLAVIFR